MEVSKPFNIRELSEIYDENNQDLYLSVYFDLVDKEHNLHIKRRINAIKATIKKRDRKIAFEKAVNLAIEKAKNLEKGYPSAAVFLHLENDFCQVGGLGARVPTKLILDASPYILPLAKFNDDYETFILVLIDGQRSEIHVIENAEAEQVGEDSHTSIGRHKKGGWSQQRYARIREGVVQKFYDRTSEQVDNVIKESGNLRIIIAGPGNAKQQFEDRLSAHAKTLVISLEDIDMDSVSPNQIFRKFVEKAKQDEADKEIEYIEKFQSKIMTGSSAITGIYEVLEAAQSGRLETLLVLEDFNIAGKKCEPCNEYMKSPTIPCPQCGSDGNEVDLVNEAVEAAIRISAHVEFTNNEYLEEIGGIAALLRW
ncbi:MAG: hypothetical protein CMB56_002900 [Methanobacteriota archaeon]|nr:MAG: hypothetical protein CMB56_002900 [Euryarchaeota archaeon]|tara:strand:- start:5983 stop:7086 length:1104 start_codon:yes stop_codon:yes gene_type:complete